MIVQKPPYYLVGDATRPHGSDEEPRVIVHCCNDAGGWGSGFVLAVSARWLEPEMAYRKWFKEKMFEGINFELGAVQAIKVGPNLWVANIIGQHGYGRLTDPTKPFIRYEAIRAGLEKLGTMFSGKDVTFHMPRIGCGLAGGTWQEMGPVVEEALKDRHVYVYDFEAQR